MILIYFADHGESPATARGHDSSRLTYEMLHVPFLIYFNQTIFMLIYSTLIAVFIKNLSKKIKINNSEFTLK